MAATQKQKIHHFKYQKLNDFKTIQVHGVYGGINLKSQLNMNFYVEAPDLVKTTQSIILNNQLQPEVFPSLDQLSSIRELHFGINMDIELAKQVVIWINNHVESYEQKVAEFNNSIKDKK